MGMDEHLSWWHAEPGTIPIEDLTVGGMLAQATAARPDGEALVMSAYDDPELQIRWTYQDLTDRVDQLARALMALGVRKNDPVALWGPNLPAWVVAELAVARAGAILVPINPTYRADELRYILRQVQASTALILPGYSRIDLAHEIARCRADLPDLHTVVTLAAPVPSLPGIQDIPGLAAQVHPGDLARRAAAVSCHDVAQLQFTSGTTGRPKAAMLTHRSITNNARQTAQRWGVTARDRWCNPLPLFHTAGCGTVALGAISAHATHLPLVRFDPRRVLKTIQAERCSMLETVPTILTALMEQQRTQRADLSCLRMVGTSGAPTPDRLGHACATQWGAPLRVLYGSTEVAPTATGTSVQDPDPLGWSTVGKPLPWVEVRVTDPVGQNPVGIGQTGEIQVKGYLVMAGYHRRPQETGAVLGPDGWFRTGDLGTMDAHGYLRVAGRLKDVIIRGGENLYPAEIENLIRRHPAVRDAAVVGVPDDFFGEEACAVITLHDDSTLTPTQLQDWMRNRATHQKVPRYVQVVDALPQTASGKIQKFRLKEQFTTHQLLEGRP